MTRPTPERLDDVLTACDAIASHMLKVDAEEDLVFDAIRIRLVEIGEAVKDLDPSLLVSEPNIPWAEIARMRDLLTHRYFDTVHAIVFTTARTDIPLLRAAIGRILADLNG
jgi:uncharacterized protein with HEPN domain|uniref:DUF86 domain-containing protein n=1 Tax=uncultured bacterium A1Q1_fos_324 TaxID=1256572 RepID=L7VVL4_9BACT|nr:hypothetical protein [uncultured bacterium A1Q1_fos_324]